MSTVAKPRGGSWNNNPQNLRSANRNNVGFRVARTLYAGADGITVPFRATTSMARRPAP
jgi:hypothetical protein